MTRARAEVACFLADIVPCGTEPWPPPVPPLTPRNIPVCQSLSAGLT
jgi:hypothetical protein